MLAYAGKARLTFSQVDLTAVVSEMTNLLEVSISKNAALVRELAPDLPLVGMDADTRARIFDPFSPRSSPAADSGWRHRSASSALTVEACS